MPLRACAVLLSFLLAILADVALLEAQAMERGDIESPSACQAGKDTVSGLNRPARHDPLMPPRADGEAVDVDLGLYIEQLADISEVNHTFRVEAFIDMIWCDPRMAFDPEEAGEFRRVYLEEKAHRMLGSIWWPDLIFVNAAASPETQHEELLVFHDGTVVYEERVSAVLAARLDVSKFPFDSQPLTVEVESFAWPKREMVLHQDVGKVGFADDFNMPSWILRDFRAEITDKKEVRDRDVFSEMILTIEAERIAAPYIYRLLLPLVLVVAASWSVFWLRPGFTDRLAVTFTTILTVVAFNFIISGRLPNVPDLTFLEAILGFSFVFLLLVVVENTVVDRFASAGDQAGADRVDRRARVLFPVFYFSGLIAVTAAFGIF